jgi:hypothetical protein
MKALETMRKNACNILTMDGNRSEYARDVVRGTQSLSGSDLKGKAKKFSASYHDQRIKAYWAVVNTGMGDAFNLKFQRNRRVFGAYCGQDDYGNALVDTDYGTKIYSVDCQ